MTYRIAMFLFSTIIFMFCSVFLKENALESHLNTLAHAQQNNIAIYTMDRIEIKSRLEALEKKDRYIDDIMKEQVK